MTKVSLFEVGPRDGLQNDPRSLSVDVRVDWISKMVAAGVRDIEVAAFVRPDRVPQMADSAEVLKKLNQKYGHGKSSPTFWSLVPNQRGLENAIHAGARAIGLFTAATESFALKNIGLSLEESLKEYSKIIPVARQQKMKIRGYISTAFGCPFEGRVKESAAYKMASKLLDLGVDQVSIGDTIGVAQPKAAAKLSKMLLKKFSTKQIAMHFHDTRGTALTNVWASFQEGIRTFDASAGGLGGCPFAPGAKGNLASEDFLYLMKELSVDSGIDYQKFCQASAYLEPHLGAPALTSRAYQAYLSQSNFTKKRVWD